MQRKGTAAITLRRGTMAMGCHYMDKADSISEEYSVYYLAVKDVWRLMRNV